jgi:hypothetical protein
VDLFWRSTPIMVRLVSEAASRRVNYHHNELVRHAYNTAAFQRSKRLAPSMLSRLIIRDRPRRRQTPAEMMHVARMITVACGGKVH